MISVSHPTGNTFVRALLQELHHRDELTQFYTTLGCGSDSIFSRPLKRRTYPIPSKKISTHSWPELQRLIGARMSLSGKSGQAPVDPIYRKLDQWVAEQLPKHKPKVIHCYEDGAFHTFQKAGEIGIHRSYELPIAHHETLRRLLLKEAERYPDWEPTLLSTSEPDEKLHRKNRELEMADVICCPSQFVLDSLPAKLKAEKTCFVTPFGTPEGATRRQKKKIRNNNYPVRFLFVGSMSQRKGLADLLEAFRKVNTRQAELFILGSPLMPMAFYRSRKVDFNHTPSCSNDKVLALMAKCDVLVLPSIAEGRALVQQEAMSQGLPILVTPNAGGEDLVKEEETGLLVEPGSPSILAEKLDWFIRNRENIGTMGQAARDHAESYSWKAYAERIIKTSFAVERTQPRG
jgi:glycosyltransferase involved in cell wall biosynthesis